MLRRQWHSILSSAILVTILSSSCFGQETLPSALPQQALPQQDFGNDPSTRYNALDPFGRENPSAIPNPNIFTTSSDQPLLNNDLNRDANNFGSNSFDTSSRGYDRDRDYGINTNRNFGNPNVQLGGNRDRTPNFNPFKAYDSNVLINEATYFIVASRMVRPGQVYRVSVSVFETAHPLTIRASIARDGVEMSADSKNLIQGVPETLLMRVPTTSVPGDYKLRVEGLYNSVMGGIAFLNETRVQFSQRSMTIFVQTDKPVYMQGETIRFRTIPITTELKGFDNAVDVYMIDPHGHIMRRWLSRQSNLGTVSLDYKLSDQPVFGEWKVRVVAQGQVEEGSFAVEEYYQTRFEVNVTMPAFFFNSDPYIYGKIMANFTNGAPVRGNLTLKATIRPIGWFNPKVLNQRYRVWHTGPRNQQDTFDQREEYLNPYNTVDQNQIDQRYQPQQTGTYQDQHVVEKHFTFDEHWPFWVEKPEWQQQYDPYSKTYRSTLPYLRYFNGTYEFKYPMAELQTLVPTLSGMEVLITAKVGERLVEIFLLNIIS